MLVDVAGWVGAPGSRVAEARAALAAREDAQSAFCAGEPAVPTLEACGKLRAAFASLVASCRQTGHLQAILTGADHQLPSEVAAAFRRTLVSSHDPAAEEQALAVQQAGRAVAGAREWQQSSGGFPRTAVFVCCMGLEAIRRVVSEPVSYIFFCKLKKKCTLRTKSDPLVHKNRTVA